jgi:hypothetical protein
MTCLREEKGPVHSWEVKERIRNEGRYFWLHDGKKSICPPLICHDGLNGKFTSQIVQDGLDFENASDTLTGLRVAV